MVALADSSPVRPVPWWRDLAFLLIAFGALYFFHLGSSPLANPDEGRNAEIAREVIATGDWVTPRLNGVNYFEKPPLVYWATAASELAFGQNEWAVRTVPAAFAIIGILATYLFARHLYDRRTGLMSAIVLGTSILWFGVGHFPVLDMEVSVFMGIALLAFISAVLEPPSARRRGLLYLLYACMALATLTKGLIGFLVTGAVMFLWLLVFNQWRRLLPLYLPTGALLFLAIALPWHVLAARHNPTWFHRYVIQEHFERYLTDTASRPGPFHYFVWIVTAGLIPWTGFLRPAIRSAVGRWADRGSHPIGWFLVTWAGFIFLFFSKSHSKLPAYILPIFPALAVLIGAWLARAWEAADPARLRVGMRVHGFLNGLLAAAFVVIVARPQLAKLSSVQAAEVRPAAIAMAFVLLTGGVLAPWLTRLRGVRVGLMAVLSTTLLFFTALQCANLPDAMKPDTKPLALIVAARAQPGDRVLHYHEFFHDFTFYARRTVDVVAYKGELELEEDAAARASGRFMDESAFRTLWTQPGRVFAVARKRDVTPRPGAEAALFADPTFHYHLIAETEEHYLFSNLP